MRKSGLTLLIVLGIVVALIVLAVLFWPWLSTWLPQSQLMEDWISYLVVDLNIGRWGPVATLLLVAVIELVWALNLGRRSDAFERQWKRLDQVHGTEVDVLNHEISLLKDERRALRAELELREDLIREEKDRLWAQFEDLKPVGGTRHRPEGVVEPQILRSRSLVPDLPELPQDVKGQWRQLVSQLERIEMITSVTVRKDQSALQAQQHADELLRLGEACYQLGHYERALAHYSKAIDLVPNNHEALINHAVVNYDLGRHQSTLQDLERALKLGENPWAYLYRGLVQERIAEEKRAQENYTRAIRLDVAFAEAYYRRGLLHVKAGEFEKALQDESRVLELDSNHAGAYSARGIARAAVGDSQWALNDLDRGCTLAPKSRNAFYNRGLVRHNLEMYDQALADFATVIELEPTFAPAFLARGNTHTALEDPWPAIADYDRAIELEPKNAAAYFARGQARVAVREYQPAVEDFGQALDLNPSSAEALAHRGLAYGSRGEYDRASRDLNRAVELDPTLKSEEQGFRGAAQT